MLASSILKYHVRVWMICGLWPPDHNPAWYRIYSVLLFGIIFVIFPSCIVINMAFAKDVKEVVSTLWICVTCCLAGIKGWCIARKRDQIQEIFKMLRIFDAGIHTTEQEGIMKKVVQDSRNLVILLSCLYYTGVTTSFILTFTKTPRAIMWPFWLPFNWLDNPSMVDFSLYYQFVASLFVALIDTTADCYGPTLSHILGGHIDVLGVTLRNLGRTNHKEYLMRLENNGDWDVTVKRDLRKRIEIHEDQASELILGNCVEYHGMFITYGKLLDNILSLHYSIQFSSSGLIICTSIFELSGHQNLERFIFFCEYLLSMSVQLFIPCYFGSAIIERSGNLNQHIYHSNWPNESIKFRKSMKIFMERARQPIVQHAAEGLFVVALPTFLTIYRYAYSLFALLKSFTN